MSKYCEWYIPLMRVKFGFANPQIRAQAQALHNFIKPGVTGVEFKNIMVDHGVMCTDPIPPVRYNGFTCPKCGSHMFRTFVINHGRVYKDFPEGSTVGACTENHYTLNECDFKWNRDIPEEENKAMYRQNFEEYMATFKPFEQLENTTP